MLKQVLKYAKGSITVDIVFPDGKITCKYCPYLRHEDAYKRYSCRVWGDWLLNPFSDIGEKCKQHIKLEGEQ